MKLKILTNKTEVKEEDKKIKGLLEEWLNKKRSEKLLEIIERRKSYSKE